MTQFTTFTEVYCDRCQGDGVDLQTVTEGTPVLCVGCLNADSYAPDGVYVPPSEKLWEAYELDLLGGLIPRGWQSVGPGHRS